jgi:catechol 2,3-dioxygenase-like lactoylglutathione lyase family enzyme
MEKMNIRRIVPDLGTPNMEASKTFYCGLLGLDMQMDLGWVATFVSPSNPTAQLTLLNSADTGGVQPNLTVEFDDASLVYAEAVKRGLEVVYL